MTMQQTTNLPPALPMPVNPHEQIQRIAAELRARTASMQALIAATMPAAPARDRIIAAHDATSDALIDMLTVLDYLYYRDEGSMSYEHQ